MRGISRLWRYDSEVLSSALRRLHRGFAAVRDAFVPRPQAVFASDVLRELPIDPATVRETAKVQCLAELGAGDVREIMPDLLRDPKAASDAARQSLESGCRLWVMAVRDELTRADLHARYDDLIVALGPVTADGRQAYGIAPVDAARRLLLDHPEYASGFAGMLSTRVPQDMLDMLKELLIPVRRHSAVTRMLRDPRVYVYLVVFIYSALRALPVVFVKEFHGSLFVLWSIDVITAVPYTWGVIALVAGKTRRIRAVGLVTTIVTFMAPYIYFGLHGRDYPPYVHAVIAVLIIGGLGIEFWKLRQERRLERRYSVALERLATSS